MIAGSAVKAEGARIVFKRELTNDNTRNATALFGATFGGNS